MILFVKYVVWRASVQSLQCRQLKFIKNSAFSADWMWKKNQIARQMGTVHLLRELSSVVIKVKFIGKGRNANHYLGIDNLTVADNAWCALLEYL